MSNYNYIDAVIARYAMGSPSEMIFEAALMDERGSLTQLFRVSYDKWLMGNAGKGTRIRLREDMRVPPLLRTWEFDEFL